jgi:type IX secretion system PorP/SprF family membrane protein
MRLTYNDALKPVKNVGLGGKIIYDKAGIFSQLYVLSSYSYNLEVNRENHVRFGLSAGIYKNSVNLVEYYNDPGYNLDPSLTDKDIKSKLKFMSDFSVVWLWKELEAGFLFSNITFGDASYKEVNLKYNPLANFQFHSSYVFHMNDDIAVVPIVMIRGGKYIRSQFELASQVLFKERFWGSLVYRDPGVVGFGAGAAIDKGIRISYNFNLATNVVLGAFNNHEINVGFNIFEYLNKR